jgi:hypothetical protein
MDAQKPEEKKPFPRWGIFLMVGLLLFAIAAGVFFMAKRRSAGNNLTPAAPNAGNAASMPGATNAGLNSSVAAPAGAPANGGMARMNNVRA